MTLTHYKCALNCSILANNVLNPHYLKPKLP